MNENTVNWLRDAMGKGSRPEHYLRATYVGGAVSRFHTHDTIKPQTVAQHSFGVACLVWLLSNETATAHELMAALTHDLGERITGDIPSPAKRALNIRAKVGEVEEEVLRRSMMDFGETLTVEQQLRLKLADALDGLAFCTQERMRGNRNMNDVQCTYEQYARDLLEQIHKKRCGWYEIALFVFHNIMAVWHQLEEQR